MPRAIRSLLFLILAACLLTGTALADMGPKSQLIVRVENAPEELYYLDLLAEGERVSRSTSETDDSSLPPDMDLLNRFYEEVPDGWYGCVSHGTPGPPIWTNNGLLGEDGVHQFSYHGVPRTYKILMVTKAGDVFLSDTYTRTVLQSSAKVDWAAKSVSIPPTWMGYALQFAATFFPTLLAEGLLLILFGFARQRRNRICFFVVNFITQGGLALLLAYHALQHGVTAWSLIPFVLAEAVVFFVESFLYARLLQGHSGARAMTYGMAANICSALLGLYLAEPVWHFVVSIS